MKRLEILCDLDSVVADLMTPWLGAYNRDYEDDLNMDRIVTWDTHLYTKPECGDKLYDYLVPELFAALEPLPGAVRSLNLMSQHHDIHFVTSSPGGCCDAKVEWVKKYFPHLGRKVCTIKDKWKVFGDVLIDDCDANLVAYKARWPEAKTISIRYAYNCKPEALSSIDFIAEDGTDTDLAWRRIVTYLSWLE